ncbi:hypothetical protein NLG97_g594 [Lecanicillium saksenae]|uniref:Uncharacterized protein n=1 Tax=Lecanicillium saksenae TaxID=468837 RepID=A0ACC1R9J1_9HYPO|nr:hypothetical protein NLG97_g594 [Lecanicillium saksenae]
MFPRLLRKARRGSPLRSLSAPHWSHTTTSRLSPPLYDQFILYGASIIEQASTQERGFALAPALQQDRYKKNLVQILTHPALEAHKPRLLVVTPPPIEERRLDHRVKSQGYSKLNRSNVVTKQYADTSRQVAKEMGVACVDLWTAFMAKAVIRALIHDGLHFTPQAYEIFYEELMKVISTTWPDEMPEHLPYAIPAWDDGAAWAAEGLNMGKDNVVRHS